MKPWFARMGWIYYPIHIIGFVVTLACFAFVANVFIVINAGAHSVSDLFYACFPFFVSAFTVLFWIASNTSTPTTHADH